MNELDESRRWYAKYGGDGEDDLGRGAGGGAVNNSAAVQGRRKKAAVRTRRRGGAATAGTGGAGAGDQAPVYSSIGFGTMRDGGGMNE